MSVGDFFCDKRYEVVHKLGYGGYSTTWFARDHQLNRYVAIKILIADVDDDRTEQEITRKLTSLLSQDGQRNRLLSVLLNDFAVVGPNGSHRCLVLEPARMNLMQAKDNSPVSYMLYFQQELCRAVIGQVIQAVGELHDNGVVHGDLHSGNVLFHLPDAIDHLSIAEFYERFGFPVNEEVERCDKQELTASVPKHVVYPVWFGTAPEELKVKEAGLFLCDFGESYLPAETKRHYTNTLQLNAPPEARFSDQPMSFPSDMWTLDCLLFKIMGVRPLFRTFFQHDDVITRQHVEVCGKLPLNW